MSTSSLLTGLTERALADLLGEPDHPSPTRARALQRWLWHEHTMPGEIPEQIQGVSRAVLARVRDRIRLPDFEIRARTCAADGTVKLLLGLGDSPVECVMIPAANRVTICVSSQSGCTRDCRFCATAQMGFIRNLSAGEIVGQVLLAAREAPEGARVRNVVFMGMGEPMDNFEEVLTAVEVLMSPSGAGLGASHITVSTSGVLPRMRRFVAECPANLALSLNGTTEAQRRVVMPLDRKWPLKALLEFMAEHSASRVFFIEYILMKEFNDTLEDAHRLVELLRPLNVRLNLIPFNPHPGAMFRRSEPEAVQAFFEIVQGAGIRTLVRHPRGEDIAAACGQLFRASEGGIEGGLEGRILGARRRARAEARGLEDSADDTSGESPAQDGVSESTSKAPEQDI